MKKISNAIKNPVWVFGLIMIVYGFYYTFKNDNYTNVVRSDARGYYAYLPALLIYNDGSFEKSSQVEKTYFDGNLEQLYLFKDKKGNINNKYFPGIALLQLPFFCLACVVSWILGYPIDGYSAIFMICHYIGSLFYTIAGLILLSRCMKLLFPDQYKKVRWIIPVLYLSSSIFFYSIHTPGFSHLYSFFLFGLFALQILKLKTDFKTKNVFYTGLILGLIALVRPTNITVILIIPFLLGSAETTADFFKKLFSDRLKHLFTGILGFLIVLFVLFLSWKWQTGQWIVWSYSGEGFNWLHPQLFAVLFSFRTGLFLHTPLMLFSLLGILLLARENKFRAVFWCIYFLINCWIISAWWCWDYESPFGNRPFTEHFFFLFLPLVYVVLSFRKLAFIGFSFLMVIGIIRFFENTSGYMGDQRFTKQNYLRSLQFWKAHNHGRWNFTRSCVPFGKMTDAYLLLNQAEAKEVKPEEEFTFTLEKKLSKPRGNERFYYKVELEKRITERSLEGVMLVIDAYKADNSKRYYRAVDLFNDRYEGENGEWVPLIFEGQVYDYLQEYDFIRVYIWNQGKKSFSIQKIKMTLEVYKAD